MEIPRTSHGPKPRTHSCVRWPSTYTGVATG